MSALDRAEEAVTQQAMAYIINKRAELGWRLDDNSLIQALIGARFSAAEVDDHFDAAKALALGPQQRVAA